MLDTVKIVLDLDRRGVRFRSLTESFDTKTAITRRRHLAASGPMPPSLACRFTVGGPAVLRIVSDEVRQHGHCDRALAELAARAGVCRALAKSVLHHLEGDRPLAQGDIPLPGLTESSLTGLMVPTACK